MCGPLQCAAVTAGSPTSTDNHSVNDGTRPFGAVNLRGRADGKTHSVITKERRFGTAITAEIEVDIRTILVGAREAILGTQRIAVGGTQIVDHDNYTGAGITERVSRRIGQADQLPACAAGGTGSGTRTGTVQVLTDCCTEARVGIKATGRGIGVTVGRAE